jgi:hypothetical protein
MQTLDDSVFSHASAPTRGAVYDHETLSLVLSSADPLHAKFLHDLLALESL